MPGKDRFQENELRVLAQVLLMPVLFIGYIGAQTGSLIIQAVIAASVGIAVGVRLYWGKIKMLFSRGKGSKGATVEEAETVEDAEGLDDETMMLEEEADSLEESLLPDSGIETPELERCDTELTSTGGETGIEE